MMNMAIRMVPVSVLSVLLAAGSFVPVSSASSGNGNAQVSTYYVNVSVFVDNLNSSYGDTEAAINFTLGLFNLINVRFQSYNNGSVTQFSITNVTEVDHESLKFLTPHPNDTEVIDGTFHDWDGGHISPLLGDWRKKQNDIPASTIAVVLTPMKIREDSARVYGVTSGNVCTNATALIYASPEDFTTYSGAPRVMAKLLGTEKETEQDDEDEEEGEEECPVSGSLPFELPTTVKSCVTAAPRPWCAEMTKPGCWRGNDGLCDEKYLPGEKITSDAMFCNLILDGATPGNTTVDDPCKLECCAQITEENSGQVTSHVCHNRTFLDGMACTRGSGKCINFACKMST